MQVSNVLTSMVNLTYAMKAMRLAGITFDMYDDRGELLAARLSEAGLKLASLGDTELLTETQLAALPDRLFAMVGTNDGDVVRKYAMHDRGHAATSMLYFLENIDNIPETLRPKIAANLVNACAWYDLEPPDELVKIALLGAVMTAVDGVNTLSSEASRHKTDMARFRAAQAAGTKVADLNGTDTMPLSGRGHGKKPSNNPVTSGKMAAWVPCGELSQLEVEKVAVVTNTHYAFPHTKEYPITTTDQVKAASAWFDEYYRDLPPLERRVFSQSLHGRAEELGIKVAGAATKYAGDSYGPHFETEMQGRIRALDGNPVAEGYKLFWEKRAAFEPSVMAEALALLDARAGIFDRFVSSDFRDAYAAVFDDSTKVAGMADAGASDFALWDVGNDTVSTDDLLNLRSHVEPHRLDRLFGPGFAHKFASSPVETFKSLPSAHQLVLARLARRTP